MMRSVIVLFCLWIALVFAAPGADAGTYHVRQDGAGDFRAIQHAIDVAVEGDEIIVHPGTYYENIQFNGANIVLRSTDPDDWGVVEATVINGERNSSVVRFGATESETCLLSGFKITEGWALYGGGISGGAWDGPHSRATIANCMISGNFATSFGGGISWCYGIIRNCIISGNAAEFGGGLDSCNGPITNCCITDNGAYFGGGLSWCLGPITNCTISGNSASYNGGGVYKCIGPITSCIIWSNDAPEGPELYDCGSISYSCIQDWAGGGLGNISDDPLFVFGPLGEYYLDPQSPCIDAENRSAEEAGLSDRTTQADGMPDSGIVDMGYHYPLPENEIDVEVICSLNADVFAPADVMQGYMGIENQGDEVTVDIYAVIVLPDGSMLSLTHDGFVDGAWPWFSEQVLPSGFTVWPEKIFDMAIPADAEAGNYTYLSAICRVSEGYSDILALDEFPFVVTAPSATDYYVDAVAGDDANDGSENSPWRTITHALSSVAATEGRPVAVHVAAGRYAFTTNGESFPLNMRSWVSLSGEDCETTILDAEELAGVISCEAISGGCIERFTITGGCALSGAGIRCSGSSPVVRDNAITGNHAENGSGGGHIPCG
ncbi:MAG: DUF1565 domain-containing protein [Candidatus Coatesbacteria bacterium]|nr:DUF1565 domain-containing protein [Candidatus Coatesbacteria bacterium]